MTNPFKTRITGSAVGMIAIISTAAWAETPVPADIAQEDAYLDVLPKVDVPETVLPIPGAVNEEFRNCRAAWPAEYERAQSGPEARALRDIYSLVRAQNVISTQDCTCSGKVASWDQVEMVADALRENYDLKTLGWQQTEVISVEAKRLVGIAKIMCGGSF